MLSILSDWHCLLVNNNYPFQNSWIWSNKCLQSSTFWPGLNTDLEDILIPSGLFVSYIYGTGRLDSDWSSFASVIYFWTLRVAHSCIYSLSMSTSLK